MNKIDKIIALLMLIFAVGFNLWLYRLEPTATIDPNDNSFQFALVDRTNSVWDFSVKECSKNYFTFPLCHVSFLSDHWVNNWAQGYNLPFYYSHIPQILIVATWRLLSLFTSHLSLFTFYHWIIYLLLCIFPIPVFISLRIIKLPWVIAGIGAILATHISTDGLYGLDPTSFLWRGYGLSSQLFAMVSFPLALAFMYRFFAWVNESGFTIDDVRKKSGVNTILNSLFINHDSYFWPAVLVVVATTAGHLGIGIITIMSIGVFALANPIQHALEQQPFRETFASILRNTVALALLAGTSIFFLSYWIVPVLLTNDYHNVSFWDPVWKFNSYGWFEISKNLFNGALFDFGRKQYFTVLVFLGTLRCLLPNTKSSTLSSKPEARNYFPFALLFFFWFLLYFGRTTWGSLIDLIPGMKEFHISRFIVGLHAAGFFLAPIGIMWLCELFISLLQRIFKHKLFTVQTHWFVSLLIYLIICMNFIPPIYQQTMRYNEHNDRLIKQANENHAKVRTGELALFDAIRSQPPGRVFAGRGGWWGKDFRVAETPYYMNLSTYGVPTSLWLPETWSPNSDIEQYFSEDKEYTYDLFNLRYVAALPSQKAEPFWKPIQENPDWKLYEVGTSGYFTTGTHAAIVTTDKLSYTNVVRLWIQSDYPKQRLYPELHFGSLQDVKDNPLPRFGMIDEANYRTLDGKAFNLFAANPVYMGPTPQLSLVGTEEVVGDMVYKTKVEVQENCVQCIVILKQSFHPNWRATIDGKTVKPFSVFPVFLAVPVTAPGLHEIIFSYKPSTLKVTLLAIEGFTVFMLCVLALKHKVRLKKIK